MNEQTMETLVSLRSHIALGRAEVERCKEFKELCAEESLPEDLQKQLDAVITVGSEHLTRCEGVLSELLKQKEEAEVEKGEEPV